MPDENLENKVKKEEPRFDPDLSPNNVYNRDVARKLGVRYSKRRRCYVDADGCMTHDRFGQRY